MSDTADQFVVALKQHTPAFGLELSERVVADLRSYFGLLQLWNTRLHLVAPCSPEEFVIRHVLESLLAVNYMAANTQVADIGSGGGFPIIPCLIARPDISATLIESSPKKAVFLREALRLVDLSERSTILVSRFEEAPAPDVSVVTCRALERFTAQFRSIVEWSPAGANLILFGGPSLQVEMENANLAFTARRIPESDQRYIFVIGK